MNKRKWVIENGGFQENQELIELYEQRPGPIPTPKRDQILTIEMQFGASVKDTS